MTLIIIADDHSIVREGLKRVLEHANDIEIVGEAVDGFEVLSWVRRGGFDLLLTDLSMPGHNGIDLIRRVRAEAPSLAILVLTMHDEGDYAVRAIRAGANGFMTKESARTELIGAIRKVASGRPHISIQVAEQLAICLLTPVDEARHMKLSDRELEVFVMLVNGISITGAADALHLSAKTVSSHKSRILYKLGMTSFSEMVQYAVMNKLITRF